jgi:hypothetical protein
VTLRFLVLRQRAGRLAQRAVRILVKARGIEHLAQPEPGLVAHVLRRRGVGEQPLEYLARLAVLA